MSSSVVRNSFHHLVFDLLVLVLGASVEEMMPKPLDVGFPVLLMASQVLALRRPALVMAIFAVAAGAMEDGISSLPMMTSVSFFLLAAVLTRWSGFLAGMAALVHPLYQFWLLLWVPSLEGNVFHRALLALPVGICTALAAGALMVWLERRVALDEAG